MGILKIQTINIDTYQSNRSLSEDAQRAWPEATLNGEWIIAFLSRWANKIQEEKEGRIYGEYASMQECYGGFDAATGTYYMGFDCWSDNGDCEWVIYAIKDGRYEEYEAGCDDLFYRGGGYDHADRMGLAHLRLD
tara:strand:- start:229 stop:633 length:405 start_codon:yes stop_codon:yes gene_type:complete